VGLETSINRSLMPHSATPMGIKKRPLEVPDDAGILKGDCKGNSAKRITPKKALSHC
jgi:hypothetical protein